MLVFEDGRLNLKDYQGKEGFELLAHVLSSKLAKVNPHLTQKHAGKFELF